MSDLFICTGNTVFCSSCPHGKPHEKIPSCIGQRCTEEADAWANDQKGCETCVYSESCQQYAQRKTGLTQLGPLDLSVKRGECLAYNKMIIFHECVPADKN
jgi:hypothetical protein